MYEYSSNVWENLCVFILVHIFKIFISPYYITYSYNITQLKLSKTIFQLIRYVHLNLWFLRNIQIIFDYVYYYISNNNVNIKMLNIYYIYILNFWYILVI